MLCLRKSEVEAALSMAAAIEVVEQAYVEYSAGRTTVPVRTQVPVPEAAGISLFMPGYVPASAGLGVKIVSVFPRNPERGLATISGVVVMLDVETGRPVAAIEAGSLTALRTGAGSGVATRHLARRDAEVVAVFGAGVQARTQLEAVCEARPIRRARVYSPHPERRRAFAEEMAARLARFPVEVVAVDTPAEAVRGADVIVTATTSKTPVFPGDAVEPGTHINAVGSFTPEMQEIDAAVLVRARERGRIVVDTLEGALEEAGDLLVPMRDGLLRREDLSGEIGAVAAGLIPGRQSAAEVTVFKSVGLAALDIAVGQAVVAAARERGLGRDVALD